MQLAMQNISISKDKTGRSDTAQELKEFNSQSFATKAKRRTICF